MLSSYEWQEWEKLQRRKDQSLASLGVSRIPVAVKDRISNGVALTLQLPGVDVASAVWTEVATNVGHILGEAASKSVRSDGVFKRFNDAGYEVSVLSDIRGYDLEVLDSIVDWSRLRRNYAGLAALSGMGTAGVVTGAEVLLLKGGTSGKGSKAAPKLGMIIASIAADLASVLGLAARTIASTGQHYGYDPSRPEEQIFIMSVLGSGLATGSTSKLAAYAQLSQMTQLLFRNASWEKLNEKTLTLIMQRMASQLGVKLTKKKLGQIVPIIGIGVGGVSNLTIIHKIANASNDAYRERFLIDRSGGELLGVESSTSPLGQGPTEIIDVLERFDVLPPGAPNE